MKEEMFHWFYLPTYLPN